MYRRTRKPNYTHEETLALLEQISMHKHILFGKSTNHQRAELWAMVADAVNSVPGGAGRTIDELKHRWKDMSHRARTAARSMYHAKTSQGQEKLTVAPSVYFDIIMKIIGEDTGALDISSDYIMPMSNESQSSASRFTDDSQTSFSRSEDVDVKPDIHMLNQFHSNDRNTVSTRSLPVFPENSFQSKHQPLTKSVSNPFNSYPGSSRENHHRISTLSSKFLQSAVNADHGNNSNPSQFRFPSMDHEKDFSQLVSSAGNRELHSDLNLAVKAKSSTPQQSSKFSAAWPQTQIPVPRPMRLDPDTEEVTELNEHGLESDSSEDDSSGSKLTINEEAGRKTFATAMTGALQQNAPPSSEHPTHPPRKRRRLETEDSAMQSMTLNDLKKLYFIRKIQMVDQRANCFRILEKKLKYELKVLKHQAFVQNMSSASTTATAHMTAPESGHPRFHNFHAKRKASQLDIENDRDGDDFDDNINNRISPVKSNDDISDENNNVSDEEIPQNIPETAADVTYNDNDGNPIYDESRDSNNQYDDVSNDNCDENVSDNVNTSENVCQQSSVSDDSCSDNVVNYDNGEADPVPPDLQDAGGCEGPG